MSSEKAAAYAVPISSNGKFTEHYHLSCISAHQHFPVSNACIHQVLPFGCDDAKVIPYIHGHRICRFGKISEGAAYNQKQHVRNANWTRLPSSVITSG